LPGHVLEVRRRAADHRAERHDRVIALARSDAPDTNGRSKAPGTRMISICFSARTVTPAGRPPHRGSASPRSCRKAGSHDGETQSRDGSPFRVRMLSMAGSQVASSTYSATSSPRPTGHAFAWGALSTPHAGDAESRRIWAPDAVCAEHLLRHAPCPPPPSGHPTYASAISSGSRGRGKTPRHPRPRAPTRSMAAAQRTSCGHPRAHR